MSVTLPLLLTAHVASYQHYSCRRKTIQQGYGQARGVRQGFATVLVTF